MTTLWQLHEALEPDPAREELGWSEGFQQAQDSILGASDDHARRALLSDWLFSYQPCLFGKIAARSGAIEFCFLSFEHPRSDEDLSRDIREARIRWQTAAQEGKKHAIIVHAVSRRLSLARPNAVLQKFAQRLSELFLLEEQVNEDEIKLDRIYFRIPNTPRDHTIRWAAGVNVFAAPGDKRWWQDHRIPSGLALSVNSVGHMAKSAQVLVGLSKLLNEVGLGELSAEVGKVESLPDALKLAMRTIRGASNTVSGRATWLVPAAEKERDDPLCPVDLGRQLEDSNPAWYRGTYHTDHTVPSLYFRDDIERPQGVSALKLDFTYLYHDSVTNPAHTTMGKGERVTWTRESPEDRRQSALEGKATKQWGQECPHEEAQQMIEELRSDRGSHGSG